MVSEEASKALIKIKGEVLGGKILEEISSFCDTNYFMLYGLLGAGIIKEVKSEKRIQDYKFIIDKNKASDVQLLKGLLFEGKSESQQYEKFGIVASFPPDKELSGALDVENLYPRLCRLVISADKQILMANPFFDREGIEKIMPYIKKAAERGVEIKIISRPKYDANPGQEVQIKNMLNVIGEKCQLRRFGGSIHGDPYHLHAKFMVADSKEAYVGSANITETSLGNNVEVGVIFSGTKVKALSNFL